MRSLGDVSAQPAKGLRHPEKGQTRDTFLRPVWETILDSLGKLSGEGQKGAKKGQKLYIYSY